MKKVVAVLVIGLNFLNIFALSDKQVNLIERCLKRWNGDNEDYWKNIPIFVEGNEDEAKEYIMVFLENSLMLDKNIKKFIQEFSYETDYIKEA